MCTREQIQRQVEEPWAGKIAAFVANKNEVTTRLVLAEALGIELGHMKDAERRRVGAVLRGLGWRRSKKRLPDGTQERVFLREPDPDMPSPAREPPAPTASEFHVPVPLFPLVTEEATPSSAVAEETGAAMASTPDTGAARTGATDVENTPPEQEAANDVLVLDEAVRVVNYDFMLQ
jgi:hypothetical protein